MRFKYTVTNYLGLKNMLELNPNICLLTNRVAAASAQSGVIRQFYFIFKCSLPIRSLSYAYPIN